MSADNWHWCPVCVDNAQAEHDRKVAELEAAYGKVPAAEWMAARDALPTSFDAESLNRTFREDWEIGLGGSVPGDHEAVIIYKGHCSVCGTSVKNESTVAVR